jgi:hypothetical protein
VSNKNSPDSSNLQLIAELAARIYSQCDLHTITETERQLVQKLEAAGFLMPSALPSGFAGKVMSAL